ncbi:MAG: Sulfatase [Verrucomicrobiales bacterium]|nr:Sulfatase [Verrucomicrobiales bacterium]
MNIASLKNCLRTLLVITLGLPLVITPVQAASSKTKPNVLLIIADDLNDWIGPLHGNPQVKTPNLDKLAARGMTFRNAQASAPLCNPSRASFMSGRRPSTTGIYDNDQPAMPNLPRDFCLNQYLRQFGYTSLGAGKIYHYHNYRPEDWDDVVFYADDTLPNHDAVRRPGPFGYRMFTEDKPDAAFNEQRAESKLVDAQSVSWCIDKLKQQKSTFFMTCGIHRPHTPWDVPKKYFDLYPLDSIQLPSVSTDDLADIPSAGLEMAHNGIQHSAIVKAGVWKDRVRAYLAAVSYADAQIGRLLDALEKSGQQENTTIIFVGDNGWHLGQKEHWSKSALWRQATRVPLIWVAPGITKAGTECETAVDLTSIFPTVCELAGVPVPKHVEGISIKPLLANAKAKWKRPAISTFLQGNHAVCTADWRYIHYADGSEELYNEKADPLEWKNEAANPKLSSVKKDLAKYLPALNATPVPHKSADGPKGKKGKRKKGGEAE